MKNRLAESAKSTASVVSATAAKEQENPNDAAAVGTISAESTASVVSTAAQKQNNDDNPGTAVAATIIAGASAAAVCC